MFLRDPANPIIDVDSLGWVANSVFNPGAVVTADGDVVLLIRVEDRCGLSAIHVARSADGRTGWRVDEAPLLAPEPDQLTARWGYEDARVSWVPELDQFVITCTAYGPPGPCVLLATTSNFESLEERRVILPPEDKNAALLPRRIDGTWLLLHRPVARGKDIWISCSDDLWGWGRPRPVLLRRDGGWWDGARLGIGPPPIETDRGWLLLYHGVRLTMSGAIYRMGAALLDRDEPWRVTHRTDDWLLGPSEPYERVGDVPNVVFPCGVIQAGNESDGDQVLHLYYGAADTTVCRASAPLDALVDYVLRTPAPPLTAGTYD